ncbi:GNAT family N-acetyltransferase [Enterococcus lactis]|uniref:GNAT family N-acetyltransferase n=2 Tax=Enterococcus TaxID=1350 RepID=UPI000F4EE0AC|nr:MULTISPECIES: GNAT family N-acetyltransferase [Enterococcus]NWJ14209.1 GNAT family N-acetyltransferase [Clostridium perfringens]MBD9740198.1 GNAT family N-acetyltransferase [Enterococcus faecium]MBD9743680.1 GNAT family N-acetyltransferase [Enterococcus faecium]MBD9755709.1 GNAT family N-acetyltransferase [Enterococcus faecium]MBD9798402.1 GNAT family N-acetyltransferase [Enterococcus faecium]
MDMEEQVKLWGLPEALKEEEITYHFHEGMETEYGIKFTLKNKNGDDIFVMDFLSPSKGIEKLKKENSPSYLRLNFIYVADPEDRRKGIASYFLERLAEFAAKIKYVGIRMDVCPNQKNISGYNRKNSMNKKELKTFYKKHLGIERSLEVIFDS